MTTLGKFRPGDRVVITARSDFYKFVDGFRGRVSHFDAGCVVVKGPGYLHGIQQADTPELTLWVRVEELELSV